MIWCSRRPECEWLATPSSHHQKAPCPCLVLPCTTGTPKPPLPFLPFLHLFRRPSLSLFLPPYECSRWRVVTPLSSHFQRSENAEVAPSPWMAEGAFLENGNPNFVSSTGEEWRILGEGFAAGLLFLTRGYGGSHLLTLEVACTG